MNSYVELNIYTYILIQLITIIILFKWKPLININLNQLEIINEMMILLTCYFMMTFTSWIHDVELKYYSIGYILIYYLIGIIIFNLFFVAVIIFKSFKK